MKSYVLALAIVMTLTAPIGCRNSPKSNQKPTVVIYSDISYKPIIGEQLRVFNSSFQEKQNTIIRYAEEVVCVKKFLKGDADMMIISRPLKANEKTYLVQNKAVFSPSQHIAYDAIAILIHPNSQNDSLFSTQDIREILTGKQKKNWYSVAIEGKKASSTLLTLMQKLNIASSELSKHIVGLNEAKEVIDFVNKRPNALGIVGVAAINQLDASQKHSFSNEIKIASILDKIEGKYFVKPYLQNVKNGRYPFIRGIFYTVKEIESGPGLRFGRFMSNERGQLIFKRSHFLPAKMNFDIREIKIKE